MTATPDQASSADATPSAASKKPAGSAGETGDTAMKGPAKAAAPAAPRKAAPSDRLELDDRLPVKMMADRVLVSAEDGEGDRTSSGGILIPATAQVGKRLRWARVRAVGPNVRNVEAGDQVLFHPDDTFDAEVRGHSYLILRERDLHAVAAERLAAGSTGLYL